jgi:hypothetical protein
MMNSVSKLRVAKLEKWSGCPFSRTRAWLEHEELHGTDVDFEAMNDGLFLSGDAVQELLMFLSHLTRVSEPPQVER